jgi:acetate kinase
MALEGIVRLTQPRADVLLVINGGSSSLKAACFVGEHQRTNFHYRIDKQRPLRDSFEDAFNQLFSDLGDIVPSKIAHRFVFGGEVQQPTALLDSLELARLEKLVEYAPIHLPLNLLGVKRCTAHFSNPSVSQWACFDNAFHYTLPELAYRLPIPSKYLLRRFGFHGLNYAHVAKQLPKKLDPNIAQGRVVVVHLGSGCSLCLLVNGQSVDTSMGYSTAGGVPMATRSGDLDPGVLLKLSESMTINELNTLIFHESGLLALSNGESSDMQTLLNSATPQAQFAVEYFTSSIRAAIGAYATKVGGLDALVFTGGIGEHAHQVRAQICQPLSFLGFGINEPANLANDTNINTMESKPILIIPADEEAQMVSMIA